MLHYYHVTLYGKRYLSYVAYVYNGEIVFLMGNRRVEISPPKSIILFYLSLALIWCQNFQDWTIPGGGDTWPSCTSERRNNKNKNEIYIRETAYVEPYEDKPREKSSLTVIRPFVDFQTTFHDISTKMAKLWWKSLNGHTTVVEGHATVGRLSNNVFLMFQAIRKNFEKSRWTVTRQRSEVTRPLADCQTTFFRRFKQFGKSLKKVADRSRYSGRKSRDRRTTVKQGFLDVSSKWENFWKKSLNGHATVVEGHATVGRLSNNVFRRFKQMGNFLKKVTERSRDSGRRSRDRRPTVKERFSDVSSNLEKFGKKSLNGHATVVGNHATVGRLSNNVLGRSKQLGIFL